MVVNMKDKLGLGEWVPGDNTEHQCIGPGKRVLIQSRIQQTFPVKKSR